MKRRDFLTIGAGALAVTSLTNAVSAQGLAVETHSLGDFLLTRTATAHPGHNCQHDGTAWVPYRDGIR